MNIKRLEPVPDGLVIPPLETETLTLVETLTFHGEALTRTLMTKDQVEVLREYYPVSPFVLVPIIESSSALPCTNPASSQSDN